jgi:hypothetical protein
LDELDPLTESVLNKKISEIFLWIKFNVLRYICCWTLFVRLKFHFLTLWFYLFYWTMQGFGAIMYFNYIWNFVNVYLRLYFKQLKMISEFEYLFLLCCYKYQDVIINILILRLYLPPSMSSVHRTGIVYNGKHLTLENIAVS